MHLVSVGCTDHDVTVWIAPDERATSAPKNMTLSHREAISLARQLLSAVETYIPESS